MILSGKSELYWGMQMHFHLTRLRIYFTQLLTIRMNLIENDDN